MNHLNEVHQDFWEDAEIISRYTRANAINDGVLIDVSQAAAALGVFLPVAFTSAAWQDAVIWTRPETYNSEAARLYDVLILLSRKLMEMKRASDPVKIGEKVPMCAVWRIQNPEGDEPKPLSLVFIVAPGDEQEPTITVMLPEED